MNAPLWLIVVVGGLTDFFITAGSGLAVAMVSQGTTAMPSGAAILLATLLGVVAMMKEVRSQLKLPPSEGGVSAPQLVKKP
jgi:hypothetical protein